ncbi:uncharacterized protein LOC122849085 isoform X2 [Aphidius gifuensis]|uniref:uncharacterized protein LOC122849085 isoform X2 n=1 Tax=Aphidius gifuensis TaxID=684658 RepID=UPI001CDCC739|nr:uncharacterized protein LOC122849085 isoform X2 [Aphidius gifuensis]
MATFHAIQITRQNLPVILFVWLSLAVRLDFTTGNRWSRQVSKSEWIPMTHSRSQFSETPSNQVPLVSLVESLRLSPESKQQYLQEQAQLHRSRNGIQKLLAIQQQQHRNQQEVYQGHTYSPNVVSSSNKMALNQNTVNTYHGIPNVSPDVSIPPRIMSDALPVYSPYELTKTGLPSEPETYDITKSKSSTISAGIQEISYFPETIPSGLNGVGKNQNTQDEIQVVYVPAETLVKRDKLKKDKNQNQKQIDFSQSKWFEHHSTYPQSHLPENIVLSSADQYIPVTHRLVEFPRVYDGHDYFLENSRQKELEHSNKLHSEMQKKAEFQMSARHHERERFPLRESEHRQNEQAKDAIERDIEQLQQLHGKYHELKDAGQTKESVVGNRQLNTDQVTALERQKNEEKLTVKKENDRMKKINNQGGFTADTSADELYSNDQKKYSTRTENLSNILKSPNNKSQTKLDHHYNYQYESTNKNFRPNQDAQTNQPTPNQPPLAIFLRKDDQTDIIQKETIDDVLKALKNAITIAVLDQVSIDAPKVFVGPSNLELLQRYAKFELPYLSSLDTSLVEKRINKLPFFVAPLSFIPPEGHSKIPFPAPHIGSVIINYSDFIPSSMDNFEYSLDFNSRPAAEFNSFISSSGQQLSITPNYWITTTPTYTEFMQEYITPQYQQSTSSSSVPNSFSKLRQQPYEHQPMNNFSNKESLVMSPFQDNTTSSVQSRIEYSKSKLPVSEILSPYQHQNIDSYNNYERDSEVTTSAYRNHLETEFLQNNQHVYSDNNSSNFHDKYPNTSSSKHTHYLFADLIRPVYISNTNGTEEKQNINPMGSMTTTSNPIITTTLQPPVTTPQIRSRKRNKSTVQPIITPIINTTTRSRIAKDQTDSSREPFNYSRSRSTSITEEYSKDSSEPKLSEGLETAKQSSITNQFRRPDTTKRHKLKPLNNTAYVATTSSEGIISTSEIATTIKTMTPATISTRHRVHTRLSSQTRKQSPIQEQSNKLQRKYVIFNGINQETSDILPSSNGYQLDSGQSRNGTYPHQQKEVQSGGDNYVRIKSSSRSKNQKLVVQTPRSRVELMIEPQTPAPFTTKEEFQEANFGDDSAYLPISNHSESQAGSKLKTLASQIQLKNITRTNITAEDSSSIRAPTLNYRRKYPVRNQSLHMIKSSADSMTTTLPSIDYTIQFRVENNESKNKTRIKSRRLSARRRSTSTVSPNLTTIDDTNNRKISLLRDENYPESLLARTKSSIDRQSVDSHQENHKTMHESKNYTAENIEVARRQKVRIPVEPLTSNEFITTESKYMNLEKEMSAVTTDHDHIEHNLRTTTYLPEIFKANTLRTIDSMTIMNTAFNDRITNHYSEILEDGGKTEENTKKKRQEGTAITEDNGDILLTTESSSIKIYTTMDNSRTISPTTTTQETTKKSWNTVKSYEKQFVTRNPLQYSEKQLGVTDDLETDRNDTISMDIDGDHLDKPKERYAKNHKSEWSEIHFPSHRKVYGYGGSKLLIETTQPPNTVSESIDDNGIETLSGYVQAMFNAMKKTDEEKHNLDNIPRFPKQKKSIKENSIISFKENSVDKNISISTDIRNNNQNFQNNSEDSLIFIEPNLNKNLMMLTSSTNGESLSTMTTIPNMSTIPFLNPVSSTSGENVTQSKLNEILTTSTPTKVSHMTEMCYKGRCIITKPRNHA